MTERVNGAPQEITRGLYREIFGTLPTGVTAITGRTEEGKNIGFVVGTFASLSIEPPLVTFSVDKSSSTWPTLRTLKNFTANILSTEQLPVCRALSRKGQDKFQGIDFTDGPLNTPVIEGSVATINCEVLSEVVAGDHYVIVGAIDSMERGEGEAMIFRAGKFGEYKGWSTEEIEQKEAAK